MSEYGAPIALSPITAKKHSLPAHLLFSLTSADYKAPTIHSDLGWLGWLLRERDAQGGIHVVPPSEDAHPPRSAPAQGCHPRRLEQRRVRGPTTDIDHQYQLRARELIGYARPVLPEVIESRHALDESYTLHNLLPSQHRA